MRRGNSFRCDERQSPADLDSQKSPSGRQDNATPPSSRARQHTSDCTARDVDSLCSSRKTEADNVRQSPRMLKTTQTEGLLSRAVLLLQRPYVFLPVFAVVIFLSTQQLLQGYSVSSLPLQRVILGQNDFQSATEADVIYTRASVVSTSFGSAADEATLLPRVKQLLVSWDPRRPPADGHEEGTRRAALKRSKVFEERSGVPRAPHLVDCSLQAKMHADQHWAERPPVGSLPAWALISDPRANASADPQAYVMRGSTADSRAFRSDAWRPTTGPLADIMQEGPFPPWVVGSDEDNYPLTRRAQRDIWVHQFPRNCSAPHVRFLSAKFESCRRHGLGAQLAFMAGALAHALRLHRVLLIRHFDRAEHEGCEGASRGQWSCYFLPETSPECRRRFIQLSSDPASFLGSDPLVLDARAAGRMMQEEEGEGTEQGGEGREEASDGNSGSRERGRGRKGKGGAAAAFFFPALPAWWGEPWLSIPAVVEAEGRMVRINRMRNRYRWWRAQAYRFLMRAPSPSLCHTLNVARHDAFGALAAREAAQAEAAIRNTLADMAAHAESTLPRRGLAAANVTEGVEEGVGETEGMYKDEAEIEQDAGQDVSDVGEGGGSRGRVLEGEDVSMRSMSGAAGSETMEEAVWRPHAKPWVPRSLISMHVRMGDKAKEMRLAGTAEYAAMLLRVRQADPTAQYLWLATEMQEVVDYMQSLEGWTLFQTDVRRITSYESMPSYETSLGARNSVENAWINLYMALDADYFIGALGSSWSYLIDSLRCTSGKLRNGFLSVNISPRW